MTNHKDQEEQVKKEGDNTDEKEITTTKFLLYFSIFTISITSIFFLMAINDFREENKSLSKILLKTMELDCRAISDIKTNISDYDNGLRNDLSELDRSLMIDKYYEVRENFVRTRAMASKERYSGDERSPLHAYMQKEPCIDSEALDLIKNP